MNKLKLPILIFALCTILASCNNEGEKRTITFENISSSKDYAQSGTFQATGKSVEVMPGQEIQISFNAQKGQTLMFATMYGNSWDLFFAPENPGIELFDNNGNPITGDISNQVKLWDAGTKKNNDPRRSKANQSQMDEDGKVKEIGRNDGNYDYPPAGEMMKLNLAYDAAGSRFTLTIHNNTNTTRLQTPFSPGVWAVSNIMDGKPVNKKPLYDKGEKAGSELAALAERGDNKALRDMLTTRTGASTTLSPVIIAVYRGDQNPFATTGGNELNNNFKEWLQLGDIENVKKSLENNPNVKSVHVISSETKPGDTSEASYNARRGDKIAFSTMVGHNSVISNNAAVDALQMNDITSMVHLSNNRTAGNQAGNDMPPVGQLVRVSIK